MEKELCIILKNEQETITKKWEPSQVAYYISYNVLSIIVQSSPFLKTLCLGSIGMDPVISELCYKGTNIFLHKRTILQRNYRKMTISWSFSYNSFEKFHGI